MTIVEHSWRCNLTTLGIGKGRQDKIIRWCMTASIEGMQRVLSAVQSGGGEQGGSGREGRGGRDVFQNIGNESPYSVEQFEKVFKEIHRGTFEFLPNYPETQTPDSFKPKFTISR